MLNLDWTRCGATRGSTIYCGVYDWYPAFPRNNRQWAPFWRVKLYRPRSSPAERGTGVSAEVHIYLTVICLHSKLYVMTKASTAFTQMPPSTLAALAQLGADLAVARLR